MTALTLTHYIWTLGDLIATGGFATVYNARSESGILGAVKLIPKDSNAGRDLLFADLAAIQAVPNVVPVIDTGETETHWALVMPMADSTLRDLLTEMGSLDFATASPILTSVLTALAALDGQVVHRDLKPENVMRVDGEWCLADFGIARYAEATTGADTQKFSMTPAYAAPEQWRSERASGATDIYAFGILTYELLTGARPFAGPRSEDFRDQHLHEQPPTYPGEAALAALLLDCLSKAPGARPRASRLLDRLGKLGQPPPSAAVEQLRQANRRISEQQAAAAAEEERQRTERARRQELYDAASQSMQRVLDELHERIVEAAPNAQQGPLGWPISLGGANLNRAPVVQPSSEGWGSYTPAFDVAASTTLELTIPEDQSGYAGRGCSLWYCDAIEEGEYRWYEVAFMVRPMMNRRTKGNPVALPPGREAGVAVSNVIGEWQLAWPFTAIDQGDQEEFIDRWLQWFADATDGELRHPSRMPERETRGYRLQ